ncbi:MAG TPA: PIN domain-containing protein [Roseiflexaceae bacterium]
MRVLLDTDVVLDLLADRQPFVVEASVLWLAHEQGRLEAFVSPITPVNVFYILRKQQGAAPARQVVGRLLTAVQICPLDRAALDAAYALPLADYEDALQAATAAAAGLDAIVTRNITDYAGAPLLILTPAEALAHLSTGHPPAAP